MGFVRDLWNDPDPFTKWTIFGGSVVSLALAGTLVFQRSRLAESQAAIDTLLPARTSGAVAPRGSLQFIADLAAEVNEYRNLLDPEARARNVNYIDPEQPTFYIQQNAGLAKLGDVSIEARANANVGPNFRDDVFNVKPRKDSPVGRENVQVFLFNVQIQPEMKVTMVRMRPEGKDHKPGMTLPSPDLWTFEAQITYRKVKQAETK